MVLSNMHARSSFRGFDAAQATRITNDWATTDVNLHDLLTGSIAVVRARARDLEQNYPYTRRFLSMLGKNVIGHKGLTFKPMVLMEDGRSRDKGANRRIARSHRQYSKLGNISSCGGYSRAGLEQMALKRVIVDGEIFFRKRYGFDKNGWGYALQPIPAEYVDELLNTAAGPGRNEIRNGIEIDEDGRAVAYHIRSGRDPYAASYGRTTRVPADEMIHLFFKERPNQFRGITMMVSGMIRQRMLNAIEEALITGTRVAACKLGYLMGDGEGPEADGEDSAGRQLMDVAPGMIEKIDGPLDFKEFDPGYPMTDFSDFLKDQLRGIASGWDVSYVNIANNLEGVNFSSIRQGELGDRDSYRCLQQFMIEGFAERWTDDWLRFAMTMGKLNLPISKLDRFLEYEYAGRAWDWVDPLKQEQANTEALANRSTTIPRILEAKGIDFDDWVEEEKETREKFKDAGIPYPEFAPIANNTGMPGEAPEE